MRYWLGWVAVVFGLILAMTGLPARADDNSCTFARDGECDEGRYGGTAACLDGSDAQDCAVVAATAQCDYAFDYECDEVRYGGGGACAEGTDGFDCEFLAAGSDGDTCAFANDGTCDDGRFPGMTSLCRPGTDASDCAGQKTPVQELASLMAAVPADIRARLGDDSCGFANDSECDDASFGGGGSCDPGTDATDCRGLAIGGDNSCDYANDGECDEARYAGGTSVCRPGTDTADCAGALTVEQQQASLMEAVPVDIRAQLGNDSCQFANDSECDDSAFGGTGSCDSGTDASDCRALAIGGDDSCRYANDGACDDARFAGASSACTPGSDLTDCAGATTIAAQQAALLDAVPADIRARLGDDSCEFASDLECDDEAFGGTGSCDSGTDASDCRAVAIGGDNSCEYANDGECDDGRYAGATSLCSPGSDTDDCANTPTREEAQANLMLELPDDLRNQLGSDACEFADDLECDDPDFGGTGACTAGTDATDCRALAIGGDDSCEYAFDNECDEPGIGGGYCTTASDATDCAAVAWMRGRDDSCVTALDGQCQEPGSGDGSCPAMTDTADCIGRSRPREARDHYFGRDDRYLVDMGAAPWRSIGLLVAGDGNCTGTLVGPRTVLTAAHCLFDDDGQSIVPESFTTGSAAAGNLVTVEITAATPAPAYDPGADLSPDGDASDWGIVTLSRDISAEIEVLPVFVLTEAEQGLIGRQGLIVDQAGYSWDTGSNLSGNQSCRVVQVNSAVTILHECDTTHGDSGSPILFTRDGVVGVIAVDSEFVDTDKGNETFTNGNLAVDSRAFAAAVAAAVAAP